MTKAKAPLIPLDIPPHLLRSLTHGVFGGEVHTDASGLLTTLGLARLPRLGGHHDYTLEVEAHAALIDMAGTLVRTHSKDALALALVYGSECAVYSTTKEEAAARITALSASLTREAGAWDLLLKHLAVWRQFDALGRAAAAKGKPARKPKGRAAL